MNNGDGVTPTGPSTSPPLNDDYLSTYKRHSLKPQCSQCVKANVACTFLIRHKKRGPIPRDPYELRRISDGDQGRELSRPLRADSNTSPGSMDRSSKLSTDSLSSSLGAHTSVSGNTAGLLTPGPTAQAGQPMGRRSSVSEPSPLDTIPLSPPLRQYAIQEDAPRKEISDHLVRIFFEHCYQDFDFLDPKSFLEDYARGVVDPILLNAICAVAARFSDHPQVVKSPQYLSGEPFAKSVRDKIMDLIDEATLPHFHALLLLSFFEYTTSRGGRGWRLEGLACRMSLELLLHLQSNVPKSEADRVTFEVKCRSFYSIVFSDIISAANGGMPPVLVSKLYKFKVPEPTVNWWVTAPTKAVLEDDTNDRAESKDHNTDILANQHGSFQDEILSRIAEPRRFRGYGPAQYVFRLAEILSRVSSYINGYTPDSDKRPSDPDSEFSILNRELSNWFESVPEDLSPSPSPEKVLSVDVNSTYMALMFYMTVILLHRPILALEDIVDATFLQSSSIQCTDAATKAAQVIQQFDADAIKYRGHTFAYAIFTTATIHVTNAFSADEDLAQSAKQYLGYHLAFMKAANPYCSMAGRFYYVIQDLYSMQAKLHAAAAPHLPNSADKAYNRPENESDERDVVGDVDVDRSMEDETICPSTTEQHRLTSPAWMSCRSPSVSSSSGNPGKSRVLPVSSLLKTDSGLVGLWRRVDEMQALDSAAHSLRQLSSKWSQTQPPGQFKIEAPSESSSLPDIAIPVIGPDDTTTVGWSLNGQSKQASTSSGSPGAASLAKDQSTISNKKDTSVTVPTKNNLNQSSSAIPSSSGHEGLPGRNESIQKEPVRMAHDGQQGSVQHSGDGLKNRVASNQSHDGPGLDRGERNSVVDERAGKEHLKAHQRSVVKESSTLDPNPPSPLLPSALPVPEEDQHGGRPSMESEYSATASSARSAEPSATSLFSDGGDAAIAPDNDLADVVAKADAAFQEVTKKYIGDKSSRDLRRRPYHPDRKPNRGGQGRPSQVRGRHHQHHEGPRLDIIPDDQEWRQYPSGTVELDRKADGRLSQASDEKPWAPNLGMFFQDQQAQQRQVMSDRFQQAVSHSPEARYHPDYPPPRSASASAVTHPDYVTSSRAGSSSFESDHGSRYQNHYPLDSVPHDDAAHPSSNRSWRQGYDERACLSRSHLQHDTILPPQRVKHDAYFDGRDQSQYNQGKGVERDSPSTYHHDASSQRQYSDRPSSSSPPDNSAARSCPPWPVEKYHTDGETNAYEDNDEVVRQARTSSTTKVVAGGSRVNMSRTQARHRASVDYVHPKSQERDYYQSRTPSRQDRATPESPTRGRHQPYPVRRAPLTPPLSRSQERVYPPPPPPFQMMRSVRLPPPLPLFHQKGDPHALENREADRMALWQDDNGVEGSPGYWDRSREPDSPSGMSYNDPSLSRSPLLPQSYVQAYEHGYGHVHGRRHEHRQEERGYAEKHPSMHSIQNQGPIPEPRESERSMSTTKTEKYVVERRYSEQLSSQQQQSESPAQQQQYLHYHHRHSHHHPAPASTHSHMHPSQQLQHRQS
ncbi:hypothetical protein BGZ83_003284 [Gryganskiella cystojenkinii]|nr:hypothetical protein BGZ83_003284 [Gryganskiella cystojenkinii]